MSKRGESIWKRKDGRWEARYIRDRTSEGKAIYASVYAKTYTEVKRKRQEALKRLDEKKLNEYKPMTFGAIIKEFLSEHQLTVKHSTLVRYVEIAQTHLYPVLGQKNIVDFNQNDANAYVSWLLSSGKTNGTPLSAKSVRDVIGVLKLVYKHAEKKEYIPSGYVSFVAPKQQKNIVQVFTPRQREKLEAFARTTEDTYRFGVYLCLYTGLRIGEICSLKWSDVDHGNSTINVKRTVMRIKDIMSNSDKKTRILIDSPKTSSSERIIPIPDTLMRLLKEVRQNSGAQPDDFVLTGTGKLIEPRNYYERYKRYLKNCGLTGFNFHALRHTFATRCIEAGIDAKVLSEVLGHASVRITLDLYVHPSLETKRSSLEKLFNA